MHKAKMFWSNPAERAVTTNIQGQVFNPEAVYNLKSCKFNPAWRRSFISSGRSFEAHFGEFRWHRKPIPFSRLTPAKATQVCKLAVSSSHDVYSRMAIPYCASLTLIDIFPFF